MYAPSSASLPISAAEYARLRGTAPSLMDPGVHALRGRPGAMAMAMPGGRNGYGDMEPNELPAQELVKSLQPVHPRMRGVAPMRQESPVGAPFHPMRRENNGRSMPTAAWQTYDDADAMSYGGGGGYSPAVSMPQGVPRDLRSPREPPPPSYLPAVKYRRPNEYEGNARDFRIPTEFLGAYSGPQEGNGMRPRGISQLSYAQQQKLMSRSHVDPYASTYRRDMAGSNPAPWARQHEMEQPRRVSREMHPSPVARSSAMSANGHDYSPGSRIVTPAAALNNVARSGLATTTRRTAMAVGPHFGPTGGMRGDMMPSGSGVAAYESLEPAPLPGARNMPPPRSMPMSNRVPQPRPSRMEAFRPPSPRGYTPPPTQSQPPSSSYDEVDASNASTMAPPPRAASKGGKPRGANKQAAARNGKTTPSTVASTPSNGSNSGELTAEPKRRCGRKSMNYSSEQKRERNRAAVKKCRQRQALKYDYLKRKAQVLASENRALSEMLVKNVELDDEKRNSLTCGIQMDILLKIKEIFTQSLPKDFVLDADSIWDLNSVLAVSMPSRCYYGIESIKDFWRTSLRMRNKGKIRSFWAWLFRLPPGDRFSEFTIEPFSPTSNLYFINWTTKSSPPLSGSIVIMFGHGHRVTLHVEVFGWLIWRYLLTNTPFPEPPLE
ncbi:hypothetical protein Poli38472_003501 [Pythium oligandrum]|uniref:BZIP domain-containing protein n=1 Tax=Pythium oligandrum TaxID=41045 RepID=A0A8K1C6M7_PYTOL|nr:hypothetical protein Poli38472_003501 [Pythium oligandrum]|eukprot:TMW57576.1 hypothetical protein Poli38472_003501 [Pythium oligandrum]